jgi:hypothetical protein
VPPLPPRLLVVGVTPPALESVIPLLLRADYHVEQQWDPAEALRRLASRRFDLVIARHPLRPPVLEAVVDAVRAHSAACRSAGLIVLAERGSAEQLRPLVGRGINRILPADAPAESLLRVTTTLLSAAPRLVRRLGVVLVQGAGARQRRAFAETLNVSSSGFLLQGAREFAVGTRMRFALDLPGDAPPVCGMAEVVRHTSEAREAVSGIALQVVSFAGNGERSLELFLRDALA